jgi:hypothetical protein
MYKKRYLQGIFSKTDRSRFLYSCVSDGTLKGGDSSMYYVGTFEETENYIKACLPFHKHSNVPGIISVLGVDNADLKVEGTSTSL